MHQALFYVSSSRDVRPTCVFWVCLKVKKVNKKELVTKACLFCVCACVFWQYECHCKLSLTAVPLVKGLNYSCNCCCDWPPFTYQLIRVRIRLHCRLSVNRLFLLSTVGLTKPSLDMPPWGRLLTPRVFKPSCSTPFTIFLRLVSIYQPIQLYFIPKTLQNTSVFSSFLIAYFYLTSHSPVFIYNTALYIILLTLCGHLQTQRVCRALHPMSGGRVGSWWLRSPMGSNMLLRPWLPLDGWLGWPDPINRLVMLCPNFD